MMQNKAIKEINNLAATHPELAAQWHPTLNGTTTPDMVASRSNKKYFWLCENGHTFELSPDTRTSGQNCYYCSGRRLLVGYNDLKSRFPDIALDWDYEKNNGRPEDYSIISTYVANWICNKCGHSWSISIRSRAGYRHSGCPNCARVNRGKMRQRTAAEVSGGITDANLLAEWDYSKNALGPDKYSPNSNAKAFWKCQKCGYEWEATIANRAKLGRGCPCCANRVIVTGINDLATTHPNIAKEWYQPENGDLTPFNVPHGSGKSVSWICPRGHVYKEAILHRTNGGTGCPVCNSGRQTSFAEQALYYYVKKIFPSAINGYKDIFTKGMELDIYIPDIQLGIEYDGVYWHGKKQATLERENRKYKICREHGIKLMRVREAKVRENEFPAANYSIYLPEGEQGSTALNHVIQMVLAEIDPESNFWTRSNVFHIWSDVSVDVDRDRFEILSYLEGPVKNSVAEVAPELIFEWDYERNKTLRPEMVAAGSSMNVNWICSKCGHRWLATVSHRALSHTGCPNCAGFILEKGVNDLATKSPELLVEWDYELNDAEGIFPDLIRYNDGRSVHWICSTCGHKWKTPVRSRTVDRRGCIQCGYKSGVALKNEKRLEIQGCISDPLLLKEWDYDKNSAIGLHPEALVPGCNKYAFWICSKCGNEWKAPIARRSKGAGCRKCADKANPDLLRKARIKQGHVIDDPLLLKEWDYDNNTKKPSDYSYGSNIKVLWKCSVCGFSWSAAIRSRCKGAGCPACAGNILVSEKNDLKTMKPELAAEWDYQKNNGVNPEDVSYSSGKKYWWICPKGHDSYSATPSHRINGTGCPICGNDKIAEKLSVAIDKLALDGTYIKTYPGLKYAAEECGVSRSAITHALKNGTVSAGYRWKYHSNNRKIVECNINAERL